jgi:LPXTG-motif cell wall-anchored protein
VMELGFDAEKGKVWAVCDDTCQGRSILLDIAQSGADDGRFVGVAAYERPTGMPNLNNEGFVVMPQSQCVGGSKPVYYADDAATDGHALRAGTIDCTVGGPTGPTGPTDPADPTGPVTPGIPTPVPGEQLVDAVRGGVSAPTAATAGSGITLSVGRDHAGETVDVWLHSTPVHLGRVLVAADGTVRVTIPAGTPGGAHRIAVVDAGGRLIGWTDITVTAAGGGATTVSRSTGTLASTGADPSGDLALAGAFVAAGALLLLLRRRRAGAARG